MTAFFTLSKDTLVQNCVVCYFGMSCQRAQFSYYEKKKIIEFVKDNEILYNIKHHKFRDSKMKKKLWAQLSDEVLGRKGECMYIVLYCIILYY